MEIVCTILSAIEDMDPEWSRNYRRLDEIFPTIPPEIVNCHLNILQEAGLIVVKRAKGERHNAGAWPIVLRLTWEGHDFIAAAKNESVWKKMLDALKEKGYGEAANAPFALVKSLLMNIAIGG